MDIDLDNLDLNELESLHNKILDSLQTALLNGASWEEVQVQRKIVTELAVAIHKRRYPIADTNPAEFLSRGSND
jgi:hypothetical protein